MPKDFNSVQEFQLQNQGVHMLSPLNFAFDCKLWAIIFKDSFGVLRRLDSGHFMTV